MNKRANRRHRGKVRRMVQALCERSIPDVEMQSQINAMVQREIREMALEIDRQMCELVFGKGTDTPNGILNGAAR